MGVRRGTTPTHTFTTDIDLSNVTVFYLTYKQNNRTIIEKRLDDVTITPETVVVKLTQSDTLKFKDDEPVKIQIRAKFENEDAVASNIITTSVQLILKDGEI